MFIGDQVKAEQVSADVNDLSNGLVLEMNLHHAFGELKWGIETRQGDTTSGRSSGSSLPVEVVETV